MRKILVVAEMGRAGPDDSAFELAAAARAAGKALGEHRVAAAVFGRGVAEAARGLAPWFDDVFVFDDPQLEIPDGEAWRALLALLIARERPLLTLIAHSNHGMDYAPALAGQAGTPLVCDCVALEVRDGRLFAVRSVYGGKLNARVSVALGDAGCMATLRPGAFPAAPAPQGAGAAIHAEAVPAALTPRRRCLGTVAPEPGAVDITQSAVLVAVGRGIEEEENLGIIHSLAEALRADVACSRPVVDKKWLPRSRQVGTSGVTVKPKVYLAIGISGSFQHMGGVKGGPFIAAINKDPAAPIFSVADVGIVGDLFELVPLLEEKVRELKG